MADTAINTKCLKCNLNFTSAKTLKNHQLEKHAQSVVKCFKCGLKFSTQERFRVHWNNKHVTVPKTTSEPKPSNSSSGETVNLTGEESESGPQKSTTAATTKKRHHAAPTTNRCTACYKSFASHQFAKLHYERVHMDWTTECEVCKKRVKKNLFVSVHLAKHRSRGEISVERILEIQKENQRINKQRNHRKKASDGELKVKIQPNVPTKCPDCQKVFISDRVMKIHWARIHYAAAQKENSAKQSDDSEKNDSGEEAKKEPTPCPQCKKMFATKGRMGTHYYQAHVKVYAKMIKKKKTAENGKVPCTTYPSIKSVSDLRSKPPDIDFNSNTCPVCKRSFASNGAAKHHFKVVHRNEKAAKCPYPQCFSRFKTLGTLRAHFSTVHPKATLPKEFELKRVAKKQKVDDKSNNDENKAELNVVEKPEQSQQNEAKKTENEIKAAKPINPLLKMFEKIREKNAQCPVVPIKVAAEVIEIEEDQSDDSGGCFTLDFEHCSVCSKKFLTREAAMLHYTNKHSDEIQMCPECEMLVTNSKQLPYHFRAKHPHIAIPLYLRSMRSNGSAKELYDQFNRNQCTICQQVFDSKGGSQKHFIDEHDIKFELCSICMQSFRSEASLLTHWAQSHEDSKFVPFEAETPMEVDDQGKDTTENVIENAMENEAENVDDSVIENVIEKAPEDTTKPDDISITDCDVPAAKVLVTANELAKATSVKSKRDDRKIYPFITSTTCPICSRQSLSRKSTVTHYKTVHTKNGITCSICVTVFANIDHLKEHWLQVHDEPWKDPIQVLQLCEKKKIEDEEINQENRTKEKASKMNVVVSLVNIKDNLDSLSPEIRKQFLALSKEMDETTTDTHSSDNEEKVSDSGHGSTPNITDEEISVDLSQNEPLDLSVPHDRSPTDDLLDKSLIKQEIINIKYESSDDLVSSLSQAIFTSRNKHSALSDNSNIIVKDEITFEEPTITE